MIDLDNIRETVVTKLSDYLGIPVIRSNTTGKLPEYPFMSYTIRTLFSNQAGTWGEYDDGKDRIPAKQIWSITIQSDDNSQCMALTLKAYDYVCHIGVQDFKDNGITIQSVGDVTNRDTILTVEYEFRNGFDVHFGFMNETESTIQRVGSIETVSINRAEPIAPIDYDKIIEDLEKRLAEAHNIINIQNNALNRLKVRLGGDSL